MSIKRSYRKFRPLRRATRFPVWADATVRLTAAIGLVMIVVLIHWFDRDGLVDHHDGHISFMDIVYFTMIFPSPPPASATSRRSAIARDWWRR